MGTFLGHIIPGLAFTIIGIWHTLNTIKTYKLKGPSNFTSSTWFPFTSTTPVTIPKHSELYLLLSFSAAAAAVQILDYPLLSLSFKPDNYEHATMFLHLAVYASVALAVDLSASPDALRSLVGTLAASVFAQELFLLSFHSADHAGLEGHYHWLLQLVVAFSFLATVATVGLPSSFMAATVRSASVLFQGCWFVVMGFALWLPRFLPKGCYSTESGSGTGGGSGSGSFMSAVACRTEEASRRATALANLQFSWTLAGIAVLVAYLCLRTDSKCVEYRKLRSGGGDVSLISSPEAEDLKQSQPSV
ncbi:transmembrane protein 45A-like [Ananas comosus]|uniref:Transmembrane protein 45A-like n=1 Tax=Ananas comosus TaxID=4615 RepID=A0A6P5EH89_ANACO|nr:transmembrane protein 45A-like [Ananas comosus]